MTFAWRCVPIARARRPPRLCLAQVQNAQARGSVGALDAQLSQLSFQEGGLDPEREPDEPAQLPEWACA
jgi:hypothetical protein